MTDHRQALAFIAKCDDAGKLRQLIKHAKAQGVTEVADAAFRRLIELVPAEKRGTVQHDFWRMVNAFEHLRTEQNGRTTRLARTRQKVARVGVLRVLEDWAVGKKTEGYDILMGLGLPELTGEAIVLRHPTHFSASAVEKAGRRLEADGVNLQSVREYRQDPHPASDPGTA